MGHLISNKTTLTLKDQTQQTHISQPNPPFLPHPAQPPAHRRPKYHTEQNLPQQTSTQEALGDRTRDGQEHEKCNEDGEGERRGLVVCVRSGIRVGDISGSASGGCTNAREVEES